MYNHQSLQSEKTPATPAYIACLIQLMFK